MDRSWWWKLSVVLFVAFGAAWFLVPSYYSFFVLPKDQRNNLKLLEERLPKWAPEARHRLNLGLDLQGGIHMVMRVDTKTALEKRTERRGIQIANLIKDVKKLGEVTTSVNPEKLELTLTAKDPATMDAIQKEIGEIAGDFREVGRNGAQLTLALDDSRVNKFKDDAVDQAKLVIERRIDKWGVAEAEIRKLGSDSIQISLPGYQDPEKAKELIGTTALLEFRLVDDKSSFFKDFYRQNPPDPKSGINLVDKEGIPQLEAHERNAILDYVKGHVPDDRQVMLECIQEPGAAKKGQVQLLPELVAGEDGRADRRQHHGCGRQPEPDERARGQRQLRPAGSDRLR